MHGSGDGAADGAADADADADADAADTNDGNCDCETRDTNRSWSMRCSNGLLPPSASMQRQASLTMHSYRTKLWHSCATL